MFRIAALNDSDSCDDNTTTSHHAATTKEAKEAEAFSLYSRALSLQREGDILGAEETFKDLISHEFLLEAARLVDEEIDNVVHPGLQLLYSIYKNMAAISAERGDLQAAMKSYLEAVKIDWSEVTVWYKIGTIGLKIYDFSLSRLAFEQGLQCNPNHWPCLDNLITLSYALNDYLRCLYYISKALQKDGCYEKGIALREEMFREQPSLREDTRDLFAYCDPEVLTTKLDKDDAEEYLEEALSIRRKKQELSRRPPPKIIKFPEKIKSNSWKAVGEALIALYNHAMHSSPNLSLSRKVDMSEYEAGIIPDTPEPMDSSDINPSDKSTDPKQSDSANTKTQTEDPKSPKTGVSNNLENSGAFVSQNTKSDVNIESKSESAEQVKLVESAGDQTCRNTDVNLTVESTTPQSATPQNTQTITDDSILQTGTQSETKMEDVVDGDIKTEQGDDKSKIPDSKIPSQSVAKPVTVIPEEILDESSNSSVKVKPESMDFETKDIVCLAQEAIATPSRPVIPREETGMEVEMKTELEDEGDDDCDEYSISTGLDMSPGRPSEPPQLEVQTPLEPNLPVSEGVECKSEPPVLGLPQAPLPTSVSPVGPVITATQNLVNTGAAATATDGQLQTAAAVSTTTDHHVQPAVDGQVKISTAVTTADLKVQQDTDGQVKPAAAVSTGSNVQVRPAASVMRSMLGLPLPASTAGAAQVTHAPSTSSHPLIAAKLISTPKSSLLLSTAMPPATSALQVTVPNPAGKMQSPPLTPRLLSPVHGLTSPRYHSAPNTPDIQTHNPFMRSPPDVHVDTPKSQSLLSIALTNPNLSSLPFHTQVGAGDAAAKLVNPQTSPTGRSLLSPTMQGQPFSLTPSAQSVPLQSTLSKHLSPVQSLMVTPASSQSALSKQLSPEENQTIAQHAAAQTLMALAQMPTKLSPPTQLSPGGVISTSSTLTGLMSGGVMQQSSEAGLSALPYPVPVEVALQDHPRTLPRELIRGPGSRRGTKRKRGGGLHLEGAGMKRRSARVRNTSRRKQEDSINMQELLYKFLPSSLTQISDDDEDMMRMDESDITASVHETTANKSVADVSATPSGASLKVTEQEEVKEFVKKCIKNCGIMDLMFRFLTTLADKSSLRWPDDLAGVYVEVYDKLRQHIKLPSVIGADDGMTEEDVQEYGRITLLWGELKLDHWLSTHSKPSGTPHRGGMHAILGAAREGEDYQTEDLWYLMTLAGCRHFMLDSWLEFAARVYWFKARLSMIQSDKNEADYCFDKLSYVMDCAKEEKDITCFKLINCKVDHLISKDQVDLQQESLQRSQSLEETQKLYEAGNYDRVVELLLQTFTQPHTAKKISEMGGSLPERHSQLMLLQDSLYRMKDYKKCLLWGEVSFNESLQKYRRAEGQNQTDWLSTIRQIFQHVNKVLDKDDSILKSLPSSNTVRLSQNLIRMIELTMDSPDSSSEVSDTVVLSWILLSRLIKSEENKLRSMLVEGEGQGHEGAGIDGAISSSLMLLNVAHEYLGRQSWCTKSQGALLLYFLGELEGEMNKPHFIREGLDMALEQCVYCLYGHPNKKGKAKHLQDHNAPVIELDWERSGIVFEHFKPKTVPEFDSFKADTVSTERETLLRRLIGLVPADIGPDKYIESVMSYINGETSTAPTEQTESSILMELYYLLADFYFKNKETPKAIKFYQQDICMNPLRLDSWAGLALARMSQLEQKLSSMELKMDVPVHKKAIAALRCFQRAVEIDETQRKLWTEYGSLAYQLHSHASRQLKMQDWFPLNSELLGIATDTKQEMLQVAQNCYWKASECEADGSEEEWLHHYMIGKVKEKKRCHPRDYLEHYRQAAIYLHEDGAFYPKKIIYAGSSPPRLAIEALEVFYRLHVAILKQLLKKDGEMVDYDLFQRFLTEAADSPFAQGKEKKHERRESQSASLDESSCSNPTPLAYSQLKARPVYHMTPQDHNYSKQKSSVDGSDSCDTAKDSQSNHSHPKRSKEKENAKSDSEKSDKNSRSESDKTSKSESDKDSKSEGDKNSQSQDGKSRFEGDQVKSEAMEVSSDTPVPLQKISSTGFIPKLDPAAEAGSQAVEVKPGVEGDQLKSVEEKPANSEVQEESNTKQGTGSEAKSDLTSEEKDNIEPNKPTEGRSEDDQSKASSDDVEMVLDPATGLMVPVPKTEEDKMDIDEVVLIEDSPNSSKKLPPKKSDDKTTSPSASTKDSGKDMDVIEISDDDSQSPVKNPIRLSLKKPDFKQVPAERSNTPRKELFKAVATATTTEQTRPTKDTEQTRPTKDAEQTKPTKDSDQAKLPKNTEQVKQVTKTDKDIDQAQPTKDTEQAKPTKDTVKPTKEDPTEEKETRDSVSGSSGSDSSSESDSDMDQHDSMDREILHTELLDKCIDALHLCVQRFPTHYKSIYRLAHVYMTSPYHKNLECARDLLLGSSNWQNLSHMRGPGLFAERKTTNFFQGIWKIPIEEIDRSGSFSSHILRSVRLLLDVLKEQRDVGMLLQVHKWLNRSPDSGKKYIRDPERQILAKSSFKFILEAIHQELQHWDRKKPRSKQIEFLQSVHKAYHHANHKLNAFVDNMKDLLIKVFKLVQRDSLEPGVPLFEQATRFCQQRSSFQSSSNTSGFMSPPSIKAPVAAPDPNTSVDNVFTSQKPSNPTILSPQHKPSPNPAILSPSPKKNLQSPFSSPTSRISNQSEAGVAQTGQSEGSKYSSQSEVSSASQSEGDDALVFTNPGSLTSAVQPQLLSMGVQRSLCLQDNPGFYPIQHQLPMMNYLDPSIYVRHLSGHINPSSAHTALTSAWSRPPEQTSLPRSPLMGSPPYVGGQPQALKVKPRHPIASSINLKTVADGMKKRLRTALLSSPQLLSSSKYSTLSSDKQSDDKLVPSASTSFASRSPQDKDFTYVLTRPTASFAMPKDDKLLSSPSSPFTKYTRSAQDIISASVVQSLKRSSDKEELIPAAPVYGELKDRQPLRHSNLEVRKPTLMSLLHQDTDVLMGESKTPLQTFPADPLYVQTSQSKQSILKSELLRCRDKSVCLNPTSSTTGRSHDRTLAYNLFEKTDDEITPPKAKAKEVDLEDMIPTIQVRIPSNEGPYLLDRQEYSLSIPSPPDSRETSSSGKEDAQHKDAHYRKEVILADDKNKEGFSLQSSSKDDVYEFTDEEESVSLGGYRKQHSLPVAETLRQDYQRALSLDTGISSFTKASDWRPAKLRLSPEPVYTVASGSLVNVRKPNSSPPSSTSKTNVNIDEMKYSQDTRANVTSSSIFDNNVFSCSSAQNNQSPQTSSTSDPMLKVGNTLEPPLNVGPLLDRSLDLRVLGSGHDDKGGNSVPEVSTVPMDGIIPSVPPTPMTLGCYNADLYEFISDDSDEHELTIDFG